VGSPARRFSTITTRLAPESSPRERPARRKRDQQSEIVALPAVTGIAAPLRSERRQPFDSRREFRPHQDSSTPPPTGLQKALFFGPEMHFHLESAMAGTSASSA
jgi:hypothetical protein